MKKDKKLLYILPEMAFTVTLQKSPKAGYFLVQTFHQINGEFIAEENFLFENLRKLFEKIETDTYTLVLPDFLFADTIINVPATQDIEIATYLRDELLPKIDVSTFSHETRTSVLLQRGKNTKVQLSAWEKELAAELKLALGKQKTVIEEIIPLSWTLKAAVSLEPSLTIAQLGERLYLAEHFVGINQTNHASITEIAKIGETVRTLKGADPNLQTAYLFTSGLIEEKLKQELKSVLPVQQLTKEEDNEAQIPSHIKQIVEVAGRTLSLEEFVLPRFSALVAGEDKKTVVAEVLNQEKRENEVAFEQEKITEELTADLEEKDLDSEQETTIKEEGSASETKEKEAVIATATTVSAVAATTTASGTLLEAAKVVSLQPAKLINKLPEGEDDKEETKLERASLSVKEEKVAEEEKMAQKETNEETSILDEKNNDFAAIFKEIEAEKEEPLNPKMAVASELEKQVEKKADVGYNKLGNSIRSREEKEKDVAVLDADKVEPMTEETAKQADLEAELPMEEKLVAKMIDKPVTGKKKGSMNRFLKQALLFILIFVVTIALGIGAGFLILKLTNKDFFNKETLPTPEPTLLPAPTPPAIIQEASDSSQAATTTPEEEVDKTKLKVLVINATGVAGQAGKVKTVLEKEGFRNITTGNKKGTYNEEGTFVLMKDKNTAIIKALEEAGGFTLTYDEDYQTEDAKGVYDAVIVLNDKTV